MLLIVGDRVDAWESHLRALAAGRPDTRHQLLDPVVVAGPWVAAAGATVRGGRAVRRALRR